MKGEHGIGFQPVCRELLVFLLFFFFAFLPSCAQYKTDRLLLTGRSALFYEDYVLSIQYFNQAIQAKPYLYEPWFYRAIAKYYLDDYKGAEADCTEAISRNPYVTGIYELRGLCRIQQKDFAGAITDYDAALGYDPENANLWHNRTLCRIQQKDYDAALCDIDTMLSHWSKNAGVYNMRAETYLLKQDTVQAIASLEKSLELDAYNGNTWAQLSAISLARSQWKEGEQQLDKAIHLLPRNANLYINRALARVNQNNLRGAMADYNVALDLSPNNYLGHYNRGLLRAQVGDDNNAITDFDFVLRLEPDNMMALYNRGLLLENTGNPRAAIDDYTKVIDEFPNFWAGLYQRASCYRKLGMTRQAELDEFRIIKAQMNKHLGKQPRLSRKQMRRRSDSDIEKYNQLAVADEQEVEHQYQSDYRGKVQNRKVGMAYQPLYVITLDGSSQQPGAVSQHTVFDHHVDSLNHYMTDHHIMHIVCSQTPLSEQQTNSYFAFIDQLSGLISQAVEAMDEAHPAVGATDGGRLADSKAKEQHLADGARRLAMLYLQRALAYAATQNYQSAIDDLSSCMQSDSLAAACWMRAVCQSRLNEFNASQGTDVRMLTANVLSDLTTALRLSESACLYYNRGNVYVSRSDYVHAEEDYTRAIALDATLAEAYYNRGLVRLSLKQTDAAIADLSKAGELGLYNAYSIIKQNINK
ncbi:MAG: tetratricopeptide repeat protein [Prevotella sp.]|nr:tetratricopeptide repeat protein [Prevotella sp.]